MKKSRLLGAVCGCVFTFIPFSSDAALVERLGGLAYYDTSADLTWLADANHVQTSGYDPDGVISWTEAKTWAAGLDVAGVTGWRLPYTLEPDPSCDPRSGNDHFVNCTGSEMGNLFYNVLGNTAGYGNPSLNTGHSATFKSDGIGLPRSVGNVLAWHGSSICTLVIRSISVVVGPTHGQSTMAT